MAWYNIGNRKAEKLVGETSLAGQMAKNRKKVESGVDTGETTQIEMNDAQEISPNANDRRGYTKEKWES